MHFGWKLYLFRYLANVMLKLLIIIFVERIFLTEKIIVVIKYKKMQKKKIFELFFRKIFINEKILCKSHCLQESYRLKSDFHRFHSFSQISILIIWGSKLPRDIDASICNSSLLRVQDKTVLFFKIHKGH